MSIFSIRTFSQQVLLASLFGVATAHAAGYTVRDLGPGTALDINNSGQVLGNGVLWDSNGLAFPLTGLSTGVKLNDQGTVLGIVSTPTSDPRYPSKQIAVRKADGTVTTLDSFSPIADEYKDLIGINQFDSVLVKGTSGLAYGYPDNQTLVPVQTVGSINNFEATGWGPSGAIIGSATQPTDAAPGYKVVHVVATATASIPAYLTPSTFLNFKPTAINIANQVVGKKDTLNSKQALTGTKAYLWSRNTGEKALPSLFLYAVTEPADINAKGQVVGTAKLLASSTTGVAFIWSQGSGTVNLNSQIGLAALSTKLLSARGINDAGQIIAQGLVNGQPRALLLTPKP